MKYLSFLIYVIYLFLLISLSFIIVQPYTAVADPIIEVKTLDSEINRLSIKYSVAPKTVYGIITCESNMLGSAVNYNRLPDGSSWSKDYSFFQINDYYHKDTMTKLGLDYYNEWDSLEYGFILLSTQGTSAWSASRRCWSSKI